ncbi:MAG: integrase [Bacteroidetes bacterium MedPE-SWsnd-G2]|nr:MAG: integrase [Bacteroidetes bacterium MedPE-SWsnd-G2]
MQSVSQFLLAVHDSVHDFNMKLNYSEPKIFTGGVDVSRWSKLSKKEQSDALKKDWYVYFSFRNPKTGKLERQTNLKGNANSYTKRANRLKVLKPIQKRLIHILEAGYNPYSEDNSLVVHKLRGTQPEAKLSKPIIEQPTPLKVVNSENKVEEKPKLVLSIKDALELVLSTKQKVLNETSYPKFKSKIGQFERWLYNNNFKAEECISLVTKKDVIEFLNDVLQRTSARTRNNSRIDISSFFQTLVDNEILQDNFVKKINVLKSKPTRNKTYTKTNLDEVHVFMNENYPTLSLFVKFMSYSVIRPIEVCRLKVGDINIEQREIYVKAKNKPLQTKRLTQILLDELPDLSKLDKDLYLFTPEGIGGEWDIKSYNKRGYFSNQFKKVKDQFGLGKEYGLYSFRHTYITMMFRKLKTKLGSSYQAKIELMPITGHSTMAALEKYLREIDAELPDDYTYLLKN